MRITMLLLLIPILSVAQIKKGNKLYDQFLYSEAIEYYLNDVSSSDSLERYEATEKLARCYMHTNNVEEAIVWLNKLKHFEESRPMVYYDLGRMLTKAEEYGRAYNQFSIFNSSYKVSRSSKKYATYCENISQLKTNESILCEPIFGLNSENSEFSPIYLDGNIYFSSDRDFSIDGTYGWTNFGYVKQYKAEIPNFSNGVFTQPSTPMLIDSEAINKHLHSGPLTISRNLNRYFITRTNAKDISEKKESIVQLSLYYGDIEDNEFKEPIPFPYNNSHYNVGHATLSEDGNTVIFSATIPTGIGQGDLYSSQFVDSTWTEPENLGGMINDFGNEVFPFLYNDTTLLFSSSSHFGYGGLDCFISHQNSEGEWSEPKNLMKPINSSYDDFGIFLFEGSEQGYVCSDRPGGKGSDDIYGFKYKNSGPLFLHANQKSSVCGYVRDQKNGEPIIDAHVFVLHPTNNMVHVYKTDSQGQFRIESPNEKLVIFHAAKEGYSETIYQSRFPLKNSPDDCLPEDLYLRKDGVDTVSYQREIYYDLDKDNIRLDASNTLDEVLEFVKDIKGNYKIFLEAHTDARASEKYNKALSLRRAKNAKKYLIKNDIPETNITFEHHGELELKVGDSDDLHLHETEHQENRRTTIFVDFVNEIKYNKSIDLDIYDAGDEFTLQIFPSYFFSKEYYDKRD